MNYRPLVLWLADYHPTAKGLIYSFINRAHECGFTNVEDLLEGNLEPKVKKYEKETEEKKKLEGMI